MRVMVTGATGFVGFHTAMALHAAGHELCLLVRSFDKMANVFEPVGLADVDCVRGDITDEQSVAKALSGCDAVVHAAAMVSIHAADAERVLHNNLRGTELVLGGAVEQGIERMVQVSSTTALFRRGLGFIGDDSPLGEAPSGYGRSKIECDRYVRALQDKGAPIYTSYPGSILGPDDPGLSEGVAGLKGMLDGRVVFDTTSGFQFIDARDLGRAHLLLLERGGPPRRFVMGGSFFRWAELADLLEEVTGERFLRVPSPAPLMKWLGSLGDLVTRFVKLELPVSLESTTYMTEWARSDDRGVHEALGLEWRDPRETLRDTIRWLQREKLLLRDYPSV